MNNKLIKISSFLILTGMCAAARAESPSALLEKGIYTEETVGNLDAAILLYQDKGKPMVEYRTYIHGKSLVYWFVFRIEKDRFEENQAQFDTVVKGLKVK